VTEASPQRDPQRDPHRDSGRRAFLIVRLGALGDIVHALPLAAALRATWPDARVDWLVDVKHRAILEHVGGLTAILSVDTRRIGGDTGIVPVVRRLRAARYDVAIDAQGLLKSSALAYLAGAARVVGMARAHLREPLSSWAYDATVEPAGPHVVDNALAIAQAVGATSGVTRRGPGEGGPPRFALQPPASDVVARVRDMLGLDAGQPFAVINPGAAWPNKRWPPERFGAVARHLRARHGWPSIVVWGPGEEDLAGAVVAAADGAAASAPATSLGELLAIIGAAGLVISGDTGPLHLAAALGTPIVGIYGPTDPARNGPWSPADITLSRHRGCACHHQRRCTAAVWCLEGLAGDEVSAAVDRRLGEMPDARAVPDGQVVKENDR
jgi:lipopolysaccharide heptosyltransferase I